MDYFNDLNPYLVRQLQLKPLILPQRQLRPLPLTKPQEHLLHLQ